jgi:hypothetical protein
MFVGAMDCYVILDGHDRLQAAALEEAEPSVLVLEHLQERPNHIDATKQERVAQSMEQVLVGRPAGDLRSVRRTNDVLRWQFPSASDWVPTTRAWPIPGGRRTWLAEVREHGAALDAELLSGMCAEVEGPPAPG